MITLYRFEDTYGMFDVFCKLLGVAPTGHSRSLIELCSNIYVEFGLRSPSVLYLNKKRVEDYRNLGIDRIVFVFDADNENGDKTDIMSLNYLDKQIKNLQGVCVGFDLEFVLCVYAAETLILYQTLHGSDFNLDSLVSPYDTNKFQNILLAYQYDIRSLKSLKTAILEYIDVNLLLGECNRLKSNAWVLNNDVLSWLSCNCSSAFKCMSVEEVLNKLSRARITHAYFCNQSRSFVLHGELTVKSVELSTDMSIEELHKIL